MWRTDCQWGAVPWTPRPALAPVWLYNQPTFPTASGGNPSCTAPTRTSTFHPKVLPGTPPPPVICKFKYTSVAHHDSIIYLFRSVSINYSLSNHGWMPFVGCALFILALLSLLSHCLANILLITLGFPETFGVKGPLSVVTLMCSAGNCCLLLDQELSMPVMSYYRLDLG